MFIHAGQRVGRCLLGVVLVTLWWVSEGNPQNTSLTKGTSKD